MQSTQRLSQLYIYKMKNCDGIKNIHKKIELQKITEREREKKYIPTLYSNCVIPHEYIQLYPRYPFSTTLNKRKIIANELTLFAWSLVPAKFPSYIFCCCCCKNHFSVFNNRNPTMNFL